MKTRCSKSMNCRKTSCCSRSWNLDRTVLRLGKRSLGFRLLSILNGKYLDLNHAMPLHYCHDRECSRQRLSADFVTLALILSSTHIYQHELKLSIVKNKTWLSYWTLIYLTWKESPSMILRQINAKAGLRCRKFGTLRSRRASQLF